jgi:hypothetical protein
MRDRDAQQMKLNNELLKKLGIVDSPLKLKHIEKGQAKFGGKKRSSGNSGNTGRAAKRKKRAIVISQNNSPEQYTMWSRAMAKSAKDEKGAQKLSGESK